MIWLLHNPISELPLPYFLILFGGLGAISLTAGGFWIWLCDGTRDDELPEISRWPDAYETAYLQGGARHVTRLTVFDLFDRGLLERINRRRPLAFFAPPWMIRQCGPASSHSELTAIQRSAWKWASTARTPAQLFDANTGLLKEIEPLCQTLIASLARRRLVETDKRQFACRIVKALLLTEFVGIGLSKLLTLATSNLPGSSGVMLIIVLGLIGTGIICRKVRLSDLGHRFLDAMRLEYADDGSTDRLLRMALYSKADQRPQPKVEVRGQLQA